MAHLIDARFHIGKLILSKTFILTGDLSRTQEPRFQERQPGGHNKEKVVRNKVTSFSDQQTRQAHVVVE
jgi:hypothetical protein